MTTVDVIDFSAWSGDASKTGEILMTEVLVRDPSGYLRGVRMTSSTDEALSLIVLWPDEEKSEIRLDGLGENVSTRWVDSDADLIFDHHHLAFVEVPAEPEPTHPEDPDPVDPIPPEEPGPVDPVEPVEPTLPVEPEPVDPGPSEPEEDPDEEDPQDPETGSGGGCFVATAAYGHRMEPDVVALRRFRDHHLVNYRLGRAFIRAYWVVGPALAARVSPDSTQGRAVRAVLSRAVKVLQRRGLTD